MLTGQELLAKVREMDGASKTELVLAAGYVTKKKDGTDRLNYTAFYEALLEAKGMGFGDASVGKAGRKLSYQTKAQFNGNLLIGKAYTALVGIKPGDPFEIRFGRNGRIILVPIGPGAEAGEGEGEDEAPAASGNGAAVPAAAPAAAPAAKEPVAA